MKQPRYIFLFFVFLMSLQVGQGQTVNVTVFTDDGTGTVPNTLSWAITQVNDGLADVIELNTTIVPTAVMPPISQPVTINGNGVGIFGNSVIDINLEYAGLELIAGSEGSVVNDVYINNYGFAGVKLIGTSDVLIQTLRSNVKKNGVHVEQCTNITLLENVFQADMDDIVGKGIHFIDVENSFIKGNIVQYHDIGIYVEGGQSVTINETNVTQFSNVGIHIKGISGESNSGHLIDINSLAYNTVAGIMVELVEGIVIKRNGTQFSPIGISLLNVPSFAIDDNGVAGTDSIAIIIQEDGSIPGFTAQGIVRNNDIYPNYGDGIHLNVQGTSPPATGIQVTENYIASIFGNAMSVIGGSRNYIRDNAIHNKR